ncbi:N-acetylmuramoyl-L-alanine amidase family protein [Clostridium botulinum]|uniref:Cell wall binding repeat domain protein n=1 Tax=Clostridium botulinum (strain Eklund 17B / Type B) TaxID=935198 RepID=B2TQI7_CLOBB|nr:cell wall binding repeat domain protein [Clostridium botulinum B str. Eklund 17B (NRP)]MBY6975622.1 N-acetylmuramoyl-L-alanine amidase family protein [Clostridium botulinum]MBY7001171.1 N-acetylmuramoyl-L-alanine amidase family protein [Clostridium botulinum]MCR1273938.1 N-acetylmuramoyl-L-alanine amidase family protein [Clostridium botulinum]NFD69298.1 N-acetylmuramoyl-L-alanine amidase family protein [Clostridium botulinum]
MIKRANKITSLLLTAAAVTSLVPATGVHAADYKRIESKDGTVYSAQAYKDGNFVIDGDVKNGDTEAIYFLKNGKYTELDEVDTGSEFNGIFNEKYLDLDNGDYFIDLTNGKVYDDDLRDDGEDDAASALRKKIKNKADDRYSDHEGLKNDLKEIKGSRYGEAWFETKYTADDKKTNGGDGNTASDLTVYTDIKGNYIDADYNLGKVRVTANGKSVSIDNTDKDFDVAGIKKALNAKVSNQDVIAQDSNNIYRRATVTIDINSSLVTEGQLSISDIQSAVNNVDGVNIDGSVKKAIKNEVDKQAGLEGATIESVKTTGAAVDIVKGEADKLTADSIMTLQGMKDAKTTSSTGVIKAVQDTIINAAQKAYDAITGDEAAKNKKAIEVAKSMKEKVITDATQMQNAVNGAKANSTSDVNIEEINGIKISEHGDVFKKASNGSVSFETIQKISKSQASKEIDGAKYSKNVTTYVISDKDGDKEDLLGGEFTAVGGKLVEYKIDGDNINAQTIELKSKAGHYYTDMSKEEDQDLDNSEAYDIDVDGNIWALNGGFIYKFDNDEDWDKVYKVDGSMEKLSVYDKNNMVTWNEDDEVYSIISDKDSSGNDGDDNNEVKKGWDKDDYGNWIFFDNEGNQVKHEWVNVNGTYYYLDEYGIMQANKWVNPFGNWYYLNADGSMAHSGWLNDRGTWYYLNDSGNMLTGWQYINGSWYFMEPSGAMKTGWINDRGTWYYLNSNGSMKTGWLNDNGTWYYLDGSGRMLSNTSVNGYTLGANGAWIR